MKDFGKIHRDVAYFGVWADETGDEGGAIDALCVLRESVERSRDQDIRHDQATGDALDYLAQHAGIAKRVMAFRRAMSMEHPVTRRNALGMAYKAMCRDATVPPLGDA